MHSNKLVISGYYGFDNAGDEAVLGGILTGLRQVAPKVEPVVLSANPVGTAATYGVTAVPRGQVAKVWQALRQSGALLSGGGSLLQDVTSRRSVYYYLGVMAMAQLAGRPCCVFGQGIGPINAPSARRAVRFALRRCKGIWVRDIDSMDLVKAMLGQQQPMPANVSVHLTPDAAFLLPPVSHASGRQLLQKTAVEMQCDKNKPMWVIAARPWASTSHWQAALMDGLVGSATAVGAVLVFIAMHNETDNALAQSLANQARGAGLPAFAINPGDLESVRLVLAGADLVIAMRLHALILASAAGVPGVAISYDPKVASFAAALRLPLVFVEQLSGADGNMKTLTLIQQAWQDRDEIADRLNVMVEVNRQAVLQGLRTAITSVGLPVADS